MKKEVDKTMAAGIQLMSLQQEKLYAQKTYPLLIIFQAMDADRKDSTIKHVMTGLKPPGVQVTSFKVPSMEEHDHDYLWTNFIASPAVGRSVSLTGRTMRKSLS
ncbi:MAG: hypothetical protein WCF90_04850 [Methanomicrobiales archaeon]